MALSDKECTGTTNLLPIGPIQTVPANVTTRPKGNAQHVSALTDKSVGTLKMLCTQWLLVFNIVLPFYNNLVLFSVSQQIALGPD